MHVTIWFEFKLTYRESTILSFLHCLCYKNNITAIFRIRKILFDDWKVYHYIHCLSYIVCTIIHIWPHIFAITLFLISSISLQLYNSYSRKMDQLKDIKFEKLFSMIITLNFEITLWNFLFDFILLHSKMTYDKSLSFFTTHTAKWTFLYTFV